MNVDTQTIDAFASSLRAKGKLPATIESYCRDARDFLEFLQKHRLPTNMVEPQTLVDFQNHLFGSSEDKENSVRRKVIGVRQFYRFLTDIRQISSTPFDDVPIPERNDQLPQGLEEWQVQAILGKCQSVNGLKEARDAAILCLLAYEGLKANEVIELSWRDYLDQGTAPTLKIRGQRSRTIQLSQETRGRVQIYREYYDKAVGTNAPDGAMFVAFKGKDGALMIPRMTRHGLKFIMYELGEKAGVKHLNTELLRHFAVTHQLSIGRTPEEIMFHFGLRRMGNIAKHAATLPRKRSRKKTP